MYNDCGFVRELYDMTGIQIEPVSRLNNIKQRYDNGCLFEELLIANYDIWERQNNMPAQITLFDYLP